MKAKKLTGAEIVIETLIEQGVTDVFGYPGGAVLNLYDALYKARRRIRHILTAHEQGASHAADGYARASGRVGVVIATSGPGASNLVTGIATAMMDSIPLIAITGNVPTDQVGRDSFQEINITGITMPITKHNYFVTDVGELADTVREAFRIAISGRPGPVLIDIPRDVQSARCVWEPCVPVAPFPAPAVPEEQIREAARMINESERPYLYIGGGAVSAGITDAVLSFADKIDGCIGCTFMGLSAIPCHRERFLGMQGMHGRYASSMANREADLIIGLGVRFSDRATGQTARYGKDAKILQIDADISEIGKNIPVTLGIVGDVADTFRRIAALCRPASHPAWQERIRKLKSAGRTIRKETDTAPPDRLTPPRIFDIINEIKDESTVIATDVGQHQMWTAQYADFARPRRFASSGGLGTMGYGLGAAIGASLSGTGKPERAILITGDGSFAMDSNELATAVSYRLPITVVLFNNGVLGMVRQWQTLFYGSRYSSTVLDRKTDFVKLAEAYGLRGERVSTPDEFRAAFIRASRGMGPYLIDAVIDPDELVLPMLPPDGSIDDIIVGKENKS